MNLNATLIVQIVVFLALWWFTAKFVWPPITKALDERSRRIAEGLAAADKARSDLAAAEKRVEQELKTARAGAAEVRGTAEKQASVIIEQARQEATEAEAAAQVAAILPPRSIEHLEEGAVPGPRRDADVRAVGQIDEEAHGVRDGIQRDDSELLRAAARTEIHRDFANRAPTVLAAGSDLCRRGIRAREGLGGEKRLGRADAERDDALDVFLDDAPYTQMPLEQTVTRMGSDARCELSMPRASGLGPWHVTFLHVGAALVVYRVGARARLMRNGVEVDMACLNDGDELDFGRVRVVVRRR